MLQQQTRRPASEIAEILDFVEAVSGLRSTIFETSFDSTVSWFGVRTENKCNELDDKGKPIHQLSDLLADSDQAFARFKAFAQSLGVVKKRTGTA